MKNLKALYDLLIISLVLFIPGLHAAAQTFTDNKVISKIFVVTAETTVEVNNKYGNVQIITWPKDSVKFIVEMKVGSSSLSRLQKIKNSVNFDFTATNYYVTGRTDFGTTGNQIFTELKNLSDVILTGSNQVQINYSVYCPENINLNIINKFGDIYIDDVKQYLRISLSNGDLRINSVKGNAQIEMGFGSGIINFAENLQLTIAYSDLKIKEAGKLNLDSKSSTLNIDKASFIKFTSRRDKYFISNTKNFYGNADFTQIWLDGMECETDCSLKFGNLNISEISKNFCRINLNTEYTDIDLSFMRESKYDADIFYHKDATVSFPLNIDNYGLKIDDDNDLKKHAWYKTGQGETLPKMRISAIQKCFISIREK